MSNPCLSLILCTYQRTAELDQLFQSLAAQTFQDFEVIVVDQNTDDRLYPYLEQAINAGLSIRHIRHRPPNLSTARNVGIHLAKGRWIGFPDDDCWYEPDLLQQLEARFRSPEILAGAVARWVELNEPEDLPLEFTWEKSRLFRDRMAASFVLFFSRALFERIGGFDSRFSVGQWFGAGEETDLLLRALHAGARVTFHPSAKVHHPMKTYGALDSAKIVARERARGTGALYVKHRLPLWVIARGLAGPILRPLLGMPSKRNLVLGWMEAIGRWEGMRRYRRSNYHLGNPRQFEALGQSAYSEDSWIFQKEKHLQFDKNSAL